MNQIKVLLFDIGGVLVELGGMNTVFEWTRNKYDHDEMMERWLLSPSVRLFESGNSNKSDFALGVINELELPVSESEFIEEFLKWPSKVFDGVKELLVELSSRFMLASLSNTNELHWPILKNDFQLIDLFEENFPSHLTGYMKPDAEAFEAVLDDLDVNPDEILFFDDSPRNVAAARELGFHVERVNGIDEVRLKLTEREIIETAN